MCNGALLRLISYECVTGVPGQKWFKRVNSLKLGEGGDIPLKTFVEYPPSPPRPEHILSDRTINSCAIPLK